MEIFFFLPWQGLGTQDKTEQPAKALKATAKTAHKQLWWDKAFSSRFWTSLELLHLLPTFFSSVNIELRIVVTIVVQLSTHPSIACVYPVDHRILASFLSSLPSPLLIFLFLSVLLRETGMAASSFHEWIFAPQIIPWKKGEIEKKKQLTQLSPSLNSERVARTLSIVVRRQEKNPCLGSFQKHKNRLYLFSEHWKIGQGTKTKNFGCVSGKL